jgi:peptidoglycan/LPS O-acetylase OafA/YrhL
MKFRYDINALRAIAVIGVLLFHFKVPYFDGGFSGVDIFFVISGYLMSRIIINGIDKKSFSFIDFYSRRVNRIVPALLALIVVLTVASPKIITSTNEMRPAAWLSYPISCTGKIRIILIPLPKLIFCCIPGRYR